MMMMMMAGDQHCCSHIIDDHARTTMHSMQSTDILLFAHRQHAAVAAVDVIQNLVSYIYICTIVAMLASITITSIVALTLCTN